MWVYFRSNIRSFIKRDGSLYFTLSNPHDAVRPSNRFRSRASLGVAAAASAAVAPSLSQGAVIGSGVLNQKVSTRAIQALLDFKENASPGAEEERLKPSPWSTM